MRLLECPGCGVRNVTGNRCRECEIQLNCLHILGILILLLFLFWLGGA